MPRHKEWGDKEITPKKDSPVRDWQFFRSVKELNRIMKERGLKVQEISEIVGVKHFTFRNYVHSPTTSKKTLPPPHVMKSLYDRLGYDFFYVITGEGKRPEEIELRRLLEGYKKENEELKRSLIEKDGIINFLKDQEGSTPS